MSAPVLLGVAALLLVLLTSCAWQMLAALPPFVDDAYIYLRYARNVAEGDGPVWNPGEQPTEGFTSSAYLALLSVSECAGWHDPARAGWFGVLFAMVTVLFSVRLAALLSAGRRGIWLLVPAAVSLSPQLGFWSTAGLETTMFAAAVLMGTIAYLGYLSSRSSPALVGTVLALMSLVRPEGLVVALVTIACESLRVLDRRSSLTALLRISGIVLAVQAAFVGWRLLTFGELLPNTYYAKTGGGLRQVANGLLYVGRSLREIVAAGPSPSRLAVTLCTLVLLLIAAALIAGWVAAGDRHRFEMGYVLTVCAGLLTAAALEGGDHFGGARFLVPVLPIAMAALGAALAHLSLRGRVGRACGVLGGMVAAVLVVTWAAANTPLTDRGRARLESASESSLPLPNPLRMVAISGSGPVFVEMGETLRAIARPQESIAVVPIGAIGYYSRLRVIDMVGIVDPWIAHTPLDSRYSASWRPGHDKGDGAYVLSRKPDLIQLVDSLTSRPFAGPDEISMQYRSIVEIWASDDFHAHYRFEPVVVAGGWYYNLYRRVREDGR